MDFEIKFSDKIVNNVFYLSGGMFRGKTFFGQFTLLLSFSEFRQSFLGPLETSLRKGCQKCLVGSQRKVLEKNRTFGKTNLWKKAPDIEWKTFGTFKNCFLRFHWKTLRKKLFTSKLYSNYTKFGLWTKNTRQVFQTCTRAVQSNISNKVLISGRNNFLSFSCDLEWKELLGRQTCFSSVEGKILKWNMFLEQKKIFPVFFTLHERLSTDLRTAFQLSGGTFWSNM